MAGLSQREFGVFKGLLVQWGLLYGYDFKGYQNEPYPGRDCSGFVTWALMTAGGPDLRATHNTQRMWNDWAPTETIRPGTVALYGADGQHIHHVMASLWDGCVIGAAGGDATTVTLAEANTRGARVQVWRSHLDMRTTAFQGWRRMPWVDE